MTFILNNAHLDYEANIDKRFDFVEGGLRLLVDADPIAYLAASACESATHHIKINDKSVYQVEGGKTELYTALGFENKAQFESMLKTNPSITYEIETRTDDQKNMKHTIKRQVAKLVKRVGAGSVELYLTDSKSNFRITEEIATILKYKGNRSSDSKPKLLSEARSYLLEELDAIMCYGMEADDKLAIEHRKAWAQAMKDAEEFYLGEKIDTEILEKKAMELTTTVLASIDKDLKQVAGKYINPDEDLGIEEIFPLGHMFLQEKGKSKKLRFNGLKAFYAQLIIGDNCDHIPNVFRCGDVRAYEVLNGCNSEEELFKACLREIYEGFHREHLESLKPEILRRTDIAINSGLFGKDNKSNRDKVQKSIKDQLSSQIAYRDKYYYSWDKFIENEDGTTSKILKERDAPISRISQIDYMLEVARLVYMLDKVPSEDGSHLWTPPDENWVRFIQEEYEVKNILRVDTRESRYGSS